MQTCGGGLGRFAATARLQLSSTPNEAHNNRSRNAISHSRLFRVRRFRTPAVMAGCKPIHGDCMGQTVKLWRQSSVSLGERAFVPVCCCGAKVIQRGADSMIG